MEIQCSSCKTLLNPDNPDARCSVMESGDILCVPCSIEMEEWIGHSEFAHWMIRVEDVHPDHAAIHAVRRS